VTTRNWLAAVATALVITGCSAPGENSQPASASQPADSGDQFTKCMKDNGVDTGTTSDDAGGGPTTISASPDDAGKRKAALDKCRQFLPDGGNVKPMNAEQLELARQFAKCMRGKGVPYPDPDPNTAGGDGAAKIPDGMDLQDPVIRRKLDECTAETNQLGPSK
jgi:hypothetical protein